MTEQAELERRRRILGCYVGAEVQLKPDRLKPKDPLRGVVGILRDVKRKRAEIDYGPPIGVFIVPIPWILLPGSIIPDPRQRPLFDE